MNKISKSKLIKLLKQLENKSYDFNYAYNKDLWVAANYHYGSWQNALKVIGINNKKVERKWSKEKIIKEFELINPAFKNDKYMKDNHSVIYCAAVFHFKSWKNFIEAVGIDYNTIKYNKKQKISSKPQKPKERQLWSKEKIISSILILSQKNANYVKKYNNSLYGAAIRHFGSWREALYAAGIKNYNDVVLQKNIDKDNILIEIQQLKTKSSKHNQKHNPRIYTAAVRYYGSWGKAIEAAGFNYDKILKNKRFTNDDILKQILELDSILVKDVIKNNKKLYGLATHRFKSWDNAIKLAGLETTYAITKEELINNIMILPNKTLNYIRKNDNALLFAAVKYFGSWRAAVMATGEDYNNIVKTYATEDLLFDILLILFECKIERQKTFPWLKYKKFLYLDFYIEEYNLAIEYNGRQHYEPVRFGSATYKEACKNLEGQKIRDLLKEKLLKDNGIKFIIINYREKISKSLLKEKLEGVGIYL